MITSKQLEQQLERAGCKFRFWGRPEIRELPHILMQNEIITKCVNGYYEGGFALLCITNLRLLLIDRKPMLLKTEDIRFDMIVEMDYDALLINSTLRIVTPNRKLIFNSWSKWRLREVLNHAQQRVIELRQQNTTWNLGRPVYVQYVAPAAAGGLALQGDAAAMAGLYAGPPYLGPPQPNGQNKYIDQ